LPITYKLQNVSQASTQILRVANTSARVKGRRNQEEEPEALGAIPNKALIAMNETHKPYWNQGWL
jgi:DUF971 family protein